MEDIRYLNNLLTVNLSQEGLGGPLKRQLEAQSRDAETGHLLT
jgi:hypothetical protein